MVVILNYVIKKSKQSKVPSLKTMLNEFPKDMRRKKFVLRIVEYNEKMEQLMGGDLPPIPRARQDLENELRGQYSDIYLCDKIFKRDQSDQKLFRNYHRAVAQSIIEKKVPQSEINKNMTEPKLRYIEKFRNNVNRSWVQALREDRRRKAALYRQAYISRKLSKTAKSEGTKKTKDSDQSVGLQNDGIAKSDGTETTEDSGKPVDEEPMNTEESRNLHGGINSPVDFNLQNEPEICEQSPDPEKNGNQQNDGNFASDDNSQGDVNLGPRGTNNYRH